MKKAGTFGTFVRTEEEIEMNFLEMRLALLVNGRRGLSDKTRIANYDEKIAEVEEKISQIKIA